MGKPFRVPLYFKRPGESTAKIELRLTNAPKRIVVRMTGGCGFMEPKKDGAALFDLFQDAFAGFSGAMLGGGVRIVNTNDPTITHPSICEIPPLVRTNCPKAVVLGVVPRPLETIQETFVTNYGLVISHSKDLKQDSIIHPYQDQCLVVQNSADEGTKWETEYQECLGITERLRQYAGFTSLLIAYNGGEITGKEIRAVAAKGWPVLLVAGSGRITDQLAGDSEFLKAHANVSVVPNNSAALRKFLVETKVVTSN